ncbi:unnamed protein product [Rhizophagus irregularis]|nr:unnamed protein product [Rhizophagus irregularis]CAB5369753.1 unnamed protein product [Rhizophagus irregularis]
MSDIFIKTIGKPTLKLDRLNLTDKLSSIRLELEKRNTIDETLSFSKKTPENEFSEIERENEEIFCLKDIRDDVNSCYFLYLIKNSRPSWKILNEKCKLDYGCTMSFDGIKKADKRAFKMKDCELTEIKTGGYERDKLEFESKEDWMKKTNLFIEGDCDDVNILNFLKLGLKGSKDENFNNEVKSTYQYTELAKVSLKVSKENLVLTDDFKNDINDAIKSKDPTKKFRKITKRYGQFIPTEIILGGRFYTKDIGISLKNSADNYIEGSVNAGVRPLSPKMGYDSNSSSQKSKFYSFNCIKILGGEDPDDENFDEKAWIESLKDYQNWDCIEFKDPISIFQFLPDDLRKETIKSIGKKILYTSTEDYDYELYELGRHGIFELRNLPDNILEIILNEEADSDVFATVVDTDEDSRNVFFNCQILKKPKTKPSIIIHGIQEKFKRLKYQLKIKMMIIGFDIHFNLILSDSSVSLYKDVYKSESSCLFNSINHNELDYDKLIAGNEPFLGIPMINRLDSSNNSLVIGHNFCNIQSNNKFRIDTFSYCVKNKRYDNLPDFSFYILIISNNTTQSFTFRFDWWNKPYISFKEPNPRYISLYLTKDINYNPIFLKQKSKEITIEYVNCDCNNTCSICKNKTLKITTDQNDAECKIYSIR